MADKDITDRDVRETLRAAGVELPDGASAPRALTAPDELAETLRQAGISATVSDKGINVSDDGFNDSPAERAALRQRQAVRRTTPPPGPGFPELEPSPEVKALAEKRGLGAQAITGVPVAGPLLDRAATAVESAFNDPNTTFGERYSRNRDMAKQADKWYASTHPFSSLTANLSGALVGTAPLAMTKLGGMLLGTYGPSLGSRVMTGGVGGAGINALDAYLRDEKGDAIGKAAMLGGAGGIGGPVVGDMFRGGTKLAASYLWPRTGALADMHPGAVNKLTAALEGETPASIAAARDRMGPHGFLGDVSTGMSDIAGGLADTPGPWKATVREAYRLRDAASAQRVEQALDTTMGRKVNLPELEKFTTEARAAAADPLYDQWRSMKVQPTPELKALIPRLEKAGAFKMAEELSGISGEPINTAFFTGGAAKQFPTTQTWDYVKQGLDRRIDQAYAAGDKQLAGRLISLKHDMVGEIEKTSAGQVWKQARGEFADRSAILDHVAAGRDTFLGGRAGLTADELAEELKGLHGPLLAARAIGLRSAAADAMRATANGDTTLRNKILAPENQDKIKLIMGDKRGGELIKSMQQEKFLKEQSQNVAHGSQTTPKKERIEALKLNPLAPWDLDLTRPSTYLPPSWVNELRPTHIIDAWRGQGHENMLSKLAQTITMPEGPRMNDLIAALQAEAVRQQRGARGAARAGNLLTGAISGSGIPVMRRRAFTDD